MSRTRSAELRHAGGARFEAATASGRTIVFGDHAEINELSPVETLVAAVASCSAMDVLPILEKKRQVVAEYRVHVTAEQRDQYPQVLTRIDVVHELAGPTLSEAAVRRAIELSATKYCPVSAMLSAGETAIHHRYIARGTGDVPWQAEGEVVVTGPHRRPEIIAPAR
jgi:putative redox protein